MLYGQPRCSLLVWATARASRMMEVREVRAQVSTLVRCAVYILKGGKLVLEAREEAILDVSGQ